MNAAQTMLYFREVGRVRDVLKARGLKFGDVERHNLHLKALGVRKSSKDFTNADLDKVLAALRAIINPGDLKSQLHALDQPELRRRDCWQKIAAILDELRIANDRAYDQNDLENRRLNYVQGLVAKVIQGKTRWDQLDDKEARVVLGIMERRMMAVRKRREKQATPEPANPDKVPF